MALPTAWNVDDRSNLSADLNGLRFNYIGPSKSNEDSVAILANYPIPQQCEFGKFYGPTFTTGDTIECFLNFRQNTVFYTKNSVHLGFVLRDLKGILYPYIEFWSQEGSVEVNFGHKKFEYSAIIDNDINDIDKLYKLAKLIEQKYQGKIFFIIGKYEKALINLTKILDSEPNDPFALKYRGETYYNCDEHFLDDTRFEENVWNEDKMLIMENVHIVTNIILLGYQTCDPEITTQGWTSGNKDIDDCIKEFQLNSLTYAKLIEWIPFDRLINIKKVGKGGFGSVYSV
ncbi:hypothetical protein RhiirA4_482287 [Rhizophagus irregularis]|uniref:B30.2/SPRY domain-containing protein n=1 Tax=Rhizophagus irregularis TaxID=588596 RepID=A0A2I1HKU8_9GLOM|nr:hypothetical protein RhiirA4_482287 [Rhizophagus irregularis]